MDPKLSNCCDLLQQLLFLVRTIKDIGGAVREPRAVLIGTCLTLAGHLFLKRFLEPSLIDFGPILARKFDPKLLKIDPRWVSRGMPKTMPKKVAFQSNFGTIVHRFLIGFQGHLGRYPRNFSKLSCKPAPSKHNGKTHGSASKMTYSQDRLR